MSDAQITIKNSQGRELISVGYVRDAQGLRGEVFVRLSAGQADWLAKFKNDQEAYLQPVGGSTPECFKFTTARPHKDGLVIKFSGVEDRTAAEQLKGTTFFIPAEYLVAAPGESLFLHEILGFEVFNVSPAGADSTAENVSQSVGSVQSFATNGVQDLLIVKNQSGDEVMIPFVKAFIQHIDFANKKIHMDLPPGLVEVNYK